MNALFTHPLPDMFAILSQPVLASSVGQWIPIVIPLAGMSIPIIIVIGSLIATHKSRKLRYETIRLALEKGQPIPEKLLIDEEHRKKPRHREGSDRRSGIVLIAVGAGIFLFLSMGSSKMASVQWLAAIPTLIGVAMLLNWFLDQKDPPPPSK